HTQGPQTRSGLTAASGLNRSTVLALVGELVERGLVIESEPVRDGRAGRPSPIVTPTDNVLALTVNPDVEAVTFALVGLGGNVRLRESTMTPPHLAPAHVAQMAQEFLKRNLPNLPPTTRLAAVGVAVPGLVDDRDHRVPMAPNLGW